MSHLLCELDKALDTKNPATLRLNFKIYGELFAAILKHIKEPPVRKSVADSVNVCMDQYDKLEYADCVNLHTVDQISKSEFKGWNESLDPKPDCGCDVDDDDDKDKKR